MSSELAPSECEIPRGHCVTCSDEGVAMRVLELGEDWAVCTDERGDRHEIAVDLVLPVALADEVLVHAGVAIRHLGAQR
jgi:hydrogenase maturation factor